MNEKQGNGGMSPSNRRPAPSWDSEDDAPDFDILSLDATDPIDIDRLADLCGDDLTLVSDVLDSFCVQGKERLISLECSVRKSDLRQAYFDAMFLIGSAQNIGAHDLHKAVQCFLDEMKSRRVEACCPGNDEGRPIILNTLIVFFVIVSLQPNMKQICVSLRSSRSMNP
mmetsp:Transcript_85268/g.227407  ORF Transcript_85268/g.227407 Transcript_85268/m.227407 type:complete len:169 (-) Transcript_85268:58-564(-)